MIKEKRRKGGIIVGKEMRRRKTKEREREREKKKTALRCSGRIGERVLIETPCTLNLKAKME